MKKIFAIIPLALLLCLALFIVGCSDENDDATQQTSGNSEDQTTTQSTGGTKNDITSDNEPNDTDEPTQTYPDKDKELNILFLGNSLIYYNEMPSMFDALAKSAGRKVTVESITKGSATMSDFASPTTEVGNNLRLKLQEKPNWDYIIIEPSRRITPADETVLNAEIESALTLQQIAKEAGGQIILYSVWGNNTGNTTIYKAESPTNIVSNGTMQISRKAHTKFMHETNLKVANALGGVLIAEAGYAFENLYATEAGINLYYSDLRHPSAEGSYLAACTIFATIFGEKTEGNTYTANLPMAAVLQKVADDTVINKVVPDLTEEETPSGDSDYNLLVIGSNLLDDYLMLDVLKDIVRDVDGKTLNYTLLRDSTFVINKLVDENNDMGMRAALAQKEWDAIILQFSRRCTASGSDVEASELNALKTIYPLLKAETDNIYIMSLNSKANPDIFKTGSIGYDKKGTAESMAAEEGTNYYKSVLETWSAELGFTPIHYGNAYIDYFKTTSTSNAQLGYLEACCVYNALFKKSIPATTTILNGLNATVAANIRAAAEKYCLK